MYKQLFLLKNTTIYVLPEKSNTREPNKTN